MAIRFSFFSILTILIIFVLIAVCSAARGNGNWHKGDRSYNGDFKLGWIIIPGISGSETTLLSSKYDVRGDYKEMTLVVGSESDYATLLATYPNAILGGSYNEKTTYMVLERPDLEYNTIEAQAKWAFDVVRALKSIHCHRIFASSTRYLVSSYEPLTESQFAQFPAETEFITLPKSAIIPVPEKNVEALRKIHAKMPVIRDRVSDLISQVNADSLTEFDRYLTGERNDSSINSRNSFSPEILDVANWIAGQYRSYGFSAELNSFDPTYGPNVIATLTGTEYPDTYVIVGAHFDSRSTDRASPTQRAPGANDDGSGTSILLEIARLIHLNGLRFKYSVILGSWCGEEQGLVGSRAYALNARQNGVDILAMLQGDMLAYRQPGERAQCAFPDRSHTPELTSVVQDIIRTYVPNVDVCETSACCSDQQSFYEQGYAATFFFERCGPIADPQYHRSEDLIVRTGFDQEQWYYNAQSMFASLLTLAEVE